MYERGRLQHVVAALSPQVGDCTPVELRVNHRHQLIAGAEILSLHAFSRVVTSLRPRFRAPIGRILPTRSPQVKSGSSVRDRERNRRRSSKRRRSTPVSRSLIRSASLAFEKGS
jgi:hypothetical protein